MGEWVNGWVDEWVNGWVDEWVNGWVGERKKRKGCRKKEGVMKRRNG